MILLTLITPLLFFILLTHPALNRTGHWLIILAPLPALLTALVAPQQALVLDWVLFGLQWQLDDLSRPLLIMTSILWLLGGVIARDYLRNDNHQQRFVLFWLLTMGGNLVLLVSRDIASFYTGFALMTFAGYGLVIHSGSARALFAGKVYLVMAVLGELAILAGFILLLPDLVEPMMHYVPLAIAEQSQPLLASTLLLGGFGVKAGLAGLHLWLPLAHPVAPTPASAVLSGAMIKAGLLAWMQLLPGGPDLAPLVNLQSLAQAMIILGFCSAFGAAVIGVLQQQSKAVLAYSSVSQMGLMTVMLGIGLLEPELWPLMVGVAVLYAVHHGLAKSALFFCVGLAQHPGRFSRFSVLLMATLPALALAGAPLTSGAAAKYAMKAPLYNAGFSDLVWWLTFAATATTALMLRYLYLLSQDYNHHDSEPARMTGWGTVAAVSCSVLVIWFLPQGLHWPDSVASWADALWPIVSATVAAGLLYLLLRRRNWPLPLLPAGDFIWPIRSILVRTARLYMPVERACQHLYQHWRTSRYRLLQGLSSHLQRLNRELTEQTIQRYTALACTALIVLFILLNLS